MEFSSRNTQRVSNRPATSPAPVAAAPKPPQASHVSQSKNTKIFKALGIVLFFSILILSVAAIISISLRENETSYVDETQYQLVTLVDKQAYFGKITNISKDYIVLNDVYYINEGTSEDDSKAPSTTLVKRGCIEIHKPQDQMYIYRDQVDFWENLRSDSKVSQAISQFKKDNPDKSKECDKLIQQQEAATAQQSTEENKDTSADTSTTSNTTTQKNTTTTNNDEPN